LLHFHSTRWSCAGRKREKERKKESDDDDETVTRLEGASSTGYSKAKPHRKGKSTEQSSSLVGAPNPKPKTLQKMDG
jgi:hypothetical protein